MGNAIMSFYSALIDLLGRCAPEMHVRLIEIVDLFFVFSQMADFPHFHFTFSFLQLISKGKGEALRIRAILRSLVPTEDLVGIISILLKMPITNKGTGQQHTLQQRTHPIHSHATTGCLVQRLLKSACSAQSIKVIDFNSPLMPF